LDDEAGEQGLEAEAIARGWVREIVGGDVRHYCPACKAAPRDNMHGNPTSPPGDGPLVPPGTPCAVHDPARGGWTAPAGPAPEPLVEPPPAKPPRKPRRKKGEMVVTGEKIGPPIEEGFLPETSAAAAAVATPAPDGDGGGVAEERGPGGGQPPGP